MMSKITIVFFTLLICIFNIQASDVGGPPDPKEIIGFWKMVPIVKPELNKVNPWPMPYQWFGFYSDGSLVSMAKTEDVIYTSEQLESIFKVVKAKAPKYVWQKNFIIVEYKGIPGQREIWGMNIFRKDVQIAKAGDLIMSLAGGSDGEPVYYRHLTPVK